LGLSGATSAADAFRFVFGAAGDLLNDPAAAGGFQSASPKRTSPVFNLSTIVRCWIAGLNGFTMKTWTSQQDLLLNRTLELVKAAIPHDARPLLLSETRERSLRPMLGDEIVAEKTIQIERDSLVEDILSLIEHVSQDDSKANATTWQAERLKVTDEISRMASDLDTLRRQVNDFKETQRKFHREREECPMTTIGKAG
jgi:hypothetical protein